MQFSAISCNFLQFSAVFFKISQTFRESYQFMSIFTRVWNWQPSLFELVKFLSLTSGTMHIVAGLTAIFPDINPPVKFFTYPPKASPPGGWPEQLTSKVCPHILAQKPWGEGLAPRLTLVFVPWPSTRGISYMHTYIYVHVFMHIINELRSFHYSLKIKQGFS